jgi:hypothetical protein
MRKSQATRDREKEASRRTPTFLLELPLQVSASQAARLRAHLEAGRQFYNAVLCEGLKRLRRMRADPAWQAARAIPRTQKHERNAAFSQLREQYGFSAYALHEAGKMLRVSWLAEHLDAVLVQRRASSPKAAGADAQGFCYVVQLALEGVPYQKPKHTVGSDVIGADLGPSTIALVPHQAEASLSLFCEVLTPDEKHIRRLQRKMERQRRAANPEHYDEKGRPKKHGKKKLVWNQGRCYQKTRRRKAAQERTLAAHRKSLHGRKVHEMVAVGNTIILEKISYKAWQKQYGKSVGLRTPGMFVEQLRRTVARTGGTLIEVPTSRTKLSQFCHGCGRHVKKPLSQRWHHCACGIGPVQRDLYSAFLASYLDPANPNPSCARQRYAAAWEGAEARRAPKRRVTPCCGSAAPQGSRWVKQRLT